MRAKLSQNAGIFIKDLLLWSLLCFIIVLGFLYADGIRQYSSISLRFDTPISGQAAYAARRYSISLNDEDTFWPTYWTEYSSSFSSEYVTVGAVCIAFSGDASLVFPANYISGAAPGVVDWSGCSVSEALAQRLWGSADVAGMTVAVDGVERIVRGVFKGDEEMALISFRDEDTTENWSAVELQGGPDNADRSVVELFASASGLGQPNSILMGNLSLLAAIMALAPFLVLAFYGLCKVTGYARKRLPVARKTIPFLFIFAFAAVLPVLLGALPGWIIPTRWSDFSFWGSMLKQTSDALREFLYITPQTRDVELKMLLLKQTGVSFLAVCLSLTVCFRWQIRGSKE